MAMWKKIPNYPAYSINTDGRVRRDWPGGSTRPGRILKGSLNKDGYLRVLLSIHGVRIDKFVHRLLAETFLGPPPSPEHTHVAHNDGDIKNCCLENVRWSTPRENILDKITHDTQTHGVNHPKAKLSPASISEARTRRMSGETVQAIADDLGVTQGALSRALLGKTWARLMPPPADSGLMEKGD